MRKITLTDNLGNVLGIGYMDNSLKDELCLTELQRQIERSGIRGQLNIEETSNIDMSCLGQLMNAYQTNLEEDYDYGQILGQLI